MHSQYFKGSQMISSRWAWNSLVETLMLVHLKNVQHTEELADVLMSWSCYNNLMTKKKTKVINTSGTCWRQFVFHFPLPYLKQNKQTNHIINTSALTGPAVHEGCGLTSDLWPRPWALPSKAQWASFLQTRRPLRCRATVRGWNCDETTHTPTFYCDGGGRGGDEGTEVSLLHWGVS